MLFLSGNTIVKRFYDGNMLRQDQHYTLTLSEKETLVHMFNYKHIRDLKDILDLFDSDHAEAILNHSIGAQVIAAIPQHEADFVPGFHLDGQALRKHHHQQILNAYNRLFFTGYRLEDLHC